jgi:hypothetical protein
MTQNVEKLYNNLEKMKHAQDQIYKGKIINVKQVTNTDFFKDEGTFDEKQGIGVTVKLNDGDVEFSQFFAIPKILGYAKSNIGLFEKKYGSFPKDDMTVDVKINDDGFFRIII